MITIGKLAKFFVLPAACAATGVVCITMYLTNQANTFMNSLNDLDIDNKPEVEEEEIKPVELPPPPSLASPSAEKPPVTDSSEQEESKESDNSSQSQNQSAGGSSEGQDVKEVIKRLVQEMNSKHDKWTSPNRSLGDFYEIVSRSHQFIEALKALSKSSEDK